MRISNINFSLLQSFSKPNLTSTYVQKRILRKKMRHACYAPLLLIYTYEVKHILEAWVLTFLWSHSNSSLRPF